MERKWKKTRMEDKKRRKRHEATEWDNGNLGEKKNSTIPNHRQDKCYS